MEASDHRELRGTCQEFFRRRVSQDGGADALGTEEWTCCLKFLETAEVAPKRPCS